jgi:hypothetical protein
MAAHKGPASSRPRCTRSGSSVAAIPVYYLPSNKVTARYKEIHLFADTVPSIFSGPCIVIYLSNNDQPDAISHLINFITHDVHVSNRLTIRHQEVTHCMYSIRNASG